MRPLEEDPMHLTVNKMTALGVLRALRRSRRRLGNRCELLPPDPSPRKRVSASMLPLETLALEAPPSNRHPLHVAVPGRANRIQAGFASCTVYSTGLPPRSFLEVADGIAIPSPELLFVELAPIMSPAVHALLGYELCGTYARDATNPRTGAITFGIEPATTVGRIAAFIDACRNVRGLDSARRTLRNVADNAWSPTESLLAVLAVLPTPCLGYGIGRILLNVRHDNPPELVALGCRASRVPDIEVEDTVLGFNYDGHEHFDLDMLARAHDDDTRRLAMRTIREKYVDDLRRNRELAARGRIVLPVTTEDLFQEGGLDAVMLEAADILETFGDQDMEHVRSTVASRTLRHARQQLIWSLLPWDAAETWARELVRRERPKAMRIIDAELTV